MRCMSQTTTSSPAADPEAIGVCGVVEYNDDDRSAFCSSLELLESPYTCEEVGDLGIFYQSSVVY